MFLKPAGAILLLCLSPMGVWGEHIHWMGDYPKAHLKAKQHTKPLMVLVVKKHDPLCQKILKQVFMDQNYIQILNRKTVPVIVTYESGMNYPVEIYYTTVFPTLFYVDAHKELFLKPPLYGREIIKEDIKVYLDLAE